MLRNCIIEKGIKALDFILRLTRHRVTKNERHCLTKSQGLKNLEQ